MKVRSSTVSRWIKEILKETGVDVDVFKVIRHVQPLPQKYVYQVFQWMIHLAESHDQINLPGKSSIISKRF